MKFIHNVGSLIISDELEITGHRDNIPDYWADSFLGSPNGVNGNTYLAAWGDGMGAKGVFEVYLLDVPDLSL